jgi:hypothetical protein
MNRYIVVTIGNMQQSIADCHELRRQKAHSNITISPVNVSFWELNRVLKAKAAYTDEQVWDVIESYLKGHFPMSLSPASTYFCVHPSPQRWRYGTPEKLESFFASLGWEKLK